MKRWSKEDTEWLIANYPIVGREESAKTLGKTVDSVRMKTYRLGLKQDISSPFFKDWQERAAKSKIGKKRPEQALVIKKLHNEGKFIVTDKQRKQRSKRMKQWIKDNGHTKGMKGKHHSQEVKKLISVKSKQTWNNYTEEQKLLIKRKQMETRIKNNNYAPKRIKCTWKSGWRTIGGKEKFFRSRWEFNYACYLEWLKSKGEIKDWFHEPDVFWFEEIKRGCVSYLPDFKVINNDWSVEYHEVKGWMDNRSKTKIKRMAKYFPDVVLIVIKEKEYKGILKKLSPLIPGWE